MRATSLPAATSERFAHVVARNSAWGMGAQIAIKILSFVFSVVILRHLGAEEYGQYAAVLAFGAMFVFIADLGLSQYIVREVARLRNSPDELGQVKELYANALALRFLLSLLAATLLILAAWFTGRPATMVGAIALGSLGLIMYSAQGTSDAVLYAYERLDLSAVARIVNQFVFIVVGGAALWFGFGYYGLVAANLLGVATITFLCWRAVRYLGVRFGAVRLERWPTLVRASIPFGIIGFTLGLSYKFDSVLLSITRSDAETGYYNAAYSLVFSAVIISNVFNTALFPSLMRRAVSSSQPLTRVYSRSLRYLLLAGLPIAVGTCVLADRLVPFLYTKAYLPSVPALQIVVWAVPLMFVTEFLGYVAVVQSHERRVARSILVSTGLNVVVNLALVPHFGFLAAAVMTVITEAILAGQYVWMLRTTLHELNWRRSVFGCLVASVAMGIVIAGAHDFALIIAIGLGAATYVIVVLGLRLVGPEELPLLKGMLHTDTEPRNVTATAANQAEIAA